MGTITFLNGMLAILILAFIAVIGINIIALLLRVALSIYAKSKRLQS